MGMGTYSATSNDMKLVHVLANHSGHLTTPVCPSATRWYCIVKVSSPDSLIILLFRLRETMAGKTAISGVVVRYLGND